MYFSRKRSFGYYFFFLKIQLVSVLFFSASWAPEQEVEAGVFSYGNVSYELDFRGGGSFAYMGDKKLL